MSRPSEVALSWAVLASVAGIGPATLVALAGRVGGPAELLRILGRTGGAAAISGELEALSTGRAHRRGPEGADLAARLVAGARSGRRTLDRIAALGIEPVALDGLDYPPRLREIPDPPVVLFVRGSVRALSAPRAVAVVGTRRPSEVGRRATARIAGAIAQAGAVVVSGLAVGVDGVAHAAAIAEAAPTVAVLGGGHGRIYPHAHRRLADEIVAEDGAVVAEVGPEVEPTRWSFPRRNRLVSGLAEATVVVEAGQGSGALITARAALEQGREAFLLPGPFEPERGDGCASFLREQHGAARVVAGISELLEDLGLSRPDGMAVAIGRDGSGERLGALEERVAAALVEGAATPDELVAAVGEPVATVLGALTLLEIRGMAVGAYGRYRPAGTLATRGSPTRSPRRSGRPSGTGVLS